MKKSCPIIEVGKINASVAQRRGGHVNIITRPLKEALKGAARLAKHQYGETSQTFKSIACRM